MLYGNEALDDLGILDGINEVIATTEADGRINAAPIGIIRTEDRLYVRLFLGTHTYENVLANGWLVANITHDAWIFAETALEDLSSKYFCRREELPVLNLSKLTNSSSHMALILTEIQSMRKKL